MTPMEVQDLLLEASAFDGRPVTEDVVSAWHRLLAPLRADQAMAAMRNHFMTEDRRLMPKHVVDGVKKIRAELARDYQGPGLAKEIPAADPDNVMEYLAEGLRARALAGDGVKQDVPQLMAGIGRPPGHILQRESRPTVVPCPDPDCRALVGRSCRTANGTSRVPHVGRIEKFEEWKKEQGRDTA